MSQFSQMEHSQSLLVALSFLSNFTDVLKTTKLCLNSDAGPTPSSWKPKAAAAATTTARAASATAVWPPLAGQQRAEQPGGERDASGEHINNMLMITL